MKFSTFKRKLKMGNNESRNKGSTTGAKVFPESDFNGEKVNVFVNFFFFNFRLKYLK